MSSRDATRAAWILAVTAAFAMAFLIGRSGSAETSRPAPDGVAMVELEVKGMSCQSCANAIKAELESVDGVVKAAVSFDRKNAVVQYRPGKVQPEELVRKIRRIGYRASIKKSR